MSTLNYQTSYLRDTIQPMMPSNTTKAQREKIMLTLGIAPLVTSEEESGANSPCLLGMTELNTYRMWMKRPLQGSEDKEVECNLDKLNFCHTNTDALLSALSAIGANSAYVEWLTNGTTQLRKMQTQQDGDYEVETVVGTIDVGGTLDEQPEMPQPLMGEDVTVLAGSEELLRGLRACIAAARMVGNENMQCCLHLHLTQEELVVECAYNGAPTCFILPTTVYKVAPSFPVHVVVSVEAAQAIVAMLAAQENQEVRLAYTGGTAESGSGQLEVQCGIFTLAADTQSVKCHNFEAMRNATYSRTLTLSRMQTAAAAQSLRKMGEKEACAIINNEGLTLLGSSGTSGKSILRVSLAEGKAATGIGTAEAIAVGNINLRRLLIGLNACYMESEAVISLADLMLSKK